MIHSEEKERAGDNPLLFLGYAGKSLQSVSGFVF